MNKPYRSIWLTFFSLLIVFGLLTACASWRNSGLPPAADGTPTPTPFQPQPGDSDSPFSAPAESQAVATNTPVPPVIVKQNEMLPVDVIPPVAGIPTEVINPLTGLPFANPVLANRRPIAIKVGNFPRYVRPQSGLSKADVIYEYYTEYGETRFIAIFYGNDAPSVGPVRSGRYFDEHVLRMYHAFLVYKFSDPRERKYFYSSDFAPFLVVPDLSVCPPFDGGRGYNDYFFDTTEFSACVERKKMADNSRQDLHSGFFTEEPQPTDQTGLRIYTDYPYFGNIYSYNYWEYDPATHKYFRYEDDADIIKTQPQRTYKELTDKSTGLPVTTDNLVVIFAPHTFTNKYDEADQVYHIDPVGTGQAFVFRDGLAYPAHWVRTDMDQPMVLVNDQGVPIYMRPGRTFFEMIGETSLSSHEGDNWYFNFQMP